MKNKQNPRAAMPREKMDMFNGPILPMILQLGVPILVSYIVNYLYLMVDMYFISLLNPESSAPLAGTGLIFPVEMVFESIASGLAGGISIVVGRLIGEKKYEECKSLGSVALAIGLCIGVPVLLLYYVGGPTLVHILGGNELSEEATKYALEYIYSVAPSALFMVLSQVIGGILLGQGLAMIPTKGFMIVTVINCILDPILMFVFKLGIVGAGLATSIAVFCSFIYIMKNINTDKVRIKVSFNLSLVKAKQVKEVLFIGLPQLLMSIAPYFIVIAFNNIISVKFGEDALNAWALTGRIDQILIIPIIALVGATVVFASQNFGRKNYQRIKDVFKLNTKIAFIMSMVLAVIYALFARNMFHGFSEIDGVIDLAVQQVYITAFTFAFMAIGMVTGSLFQATNRPVFGMAFIYFRVAIIIALGVILVYALGMPVESIYYSIAIGNVLSFPLALLLFSRHIKKMEAGEIEIQ